MIIKLIAPMPPGTVLAMPGGDIVVDADGMIGLEDKDTIASLRAIGFKSPRLKRDEPIEVKVEEPKSDAVESESAKKNKGKQGRF
jgi:hypothetical protein